MTREITACPDCDSPSVTLRAGTDFGGRPYHGPGQYRCEDCGARFDEPITREARTGHGLGGLAQRLHDADADDVTADDEQLVTDGGGQNVHAAYAELNRSERDVLWAVRHHGPASGRELIDALDDALKREYHRQLVYPALRALVDADLVENGQRDRREQWNDTTGFGAAVLGARLDWERGDTALATDGGALTTASPDAASDVAYSELTAFSRDLAWVLQHTAPTHGLGVREHLQAYYGEAINPSRPYPGLDRLTDADLVSKRGVDGRTNEYALTTRGERALDARHTWQHSGGDDA